MFAISKKNFNPRILIQNIISITMETTKLTVVYSNWKKNTTSNGLTILENME